MGRPDPSSRQRPHAAIAARFRSLRAAERLAVIGALVMLGSLLLPWYGVDLVAEVSQTGIDAFSWGQAALCLTAVSVLLIASESGRRPLPRPLTAGALVAAAGAWGAVLVAYLMVDRPDSFRPFDVTLRYGLFVAMGGAVAVVVAGGRMSRRRDRPSLREKSETEGV